MINIIKKSLQDILSPTVLMFILKVGLGSILFWIATLWYFWGSFSSFTTSFLSWIPFEWLRESVIYVAAPLVGYILIIVTISTLTSLYSEKVLIALAKKHYPKVNVVASPSIGGSIGATLSSTLLFLFLVIILFPFLFIPVLGQALMLYLWSILLKAPTVHDVGGLFITDKKELKQKRKKSNLIAMIASLFNYIPLLNIFAPLFAQIMFLHQILGQNR